MRAGNCMNYEQYIYHLLKENCHRYSEKIQKEFCSNPPTCHDILEHSEFVCDLALRAEKLSTTSTQGADMIFIILPMISLTTELVKKEEKNAYYPQHSLIFSSSANAFNAQ